MQLHQRDIPLMAFLRECERSSLSKKILDCGAGGRTPPLAIFYKKGYETHGIEISERQIERANEYEKTHDMNFNIQKGDIRNIPYKDGSFSFAFSHHTIFHMTKKDIKKTIQEMERVLVKDGLLFINVRSIDSSDYGHGKELGSGEFLSKHGSEDVIHTYFEDNEIDKVLTNFKIIFKKKWHLFTAEDWTNNLVMIEYIARKK
ncbi:MAG: class I SAM-dependent methyltransferase [Asgard group archaeon]|nr:class I SAM-dependent methyltransferase [Asgard group archaeon]